MAGQDWRKVLQELKPEAKSFNLSAVADEVAARFERQYELYPVEVFDDHLIAQVWQETSRGFFKVPFVATVSAVAGDPNELEALTDVVFAPRDLWVRVLPTFVEFTTLKQADGRTRWLMVSSGGFEDRDEELVSTALLESAVKAADETGERGPLLIFHVPGSEIGTCDTQVITGEPGFLVESGLFAENAAGQRAAAYFAEHAKEYGGSIKFVYSRRTVDGVYLPPGLILERSVLPRERAAFPWSTVAVWEVEKMAGINEAKLAELKKILGDELADQVVAGLDASAERLKAAGVRWKEARATEDQVLAAEPPAAAATALEVVLTPEAIAAVVKETTAAVLAAVQPALVADLAGVQQEVAKLTAAVAAVQQADDEKLAEKVRNLPRATVKALQSDGVIRPTQRQGEGSAAAQAKSLQARGLQTLYGARPEQED